MESFSVGRKWRRKKLQQADRPEVYPNAMPEAAIMNGQQLRVGHHWKRSG
jgi:hypothetical protein